MFRVMTSVPGLGRAVSLSGFRGNKRLSLLLAAMMFCATSAASGAITSFRPRGSTSSYRPSQEKKSLSGGKTLSEKSEGKSDKKTVSTLGKEGTGFSSITGKSLGGMKSVQGKGASGVLRSGSREAFVPKLNEVIRPKLDFADTKISLLEAKNMNVVDYLEELSVIIDWTVIVSPNVSGMTINAFLKDTTLQDALRVLELHGITFEQYGKTLVVMTTEEYYEREFGALKSEIFKIKHADVTHVQEGADALLSPKGRILTDPRTTTMIVFDTEENLGFIRKLVGILDIEMKPFRYVVKHASADEMLAQIESELSPAGTARTDERTNSLVITDIPERVKTISALLKSIDVRKDVEIRHFDLKHASSKDVLELIEEQLSPIGIALALNRTNSIRVEDTKERMQKIAELIASADIKLMSKTFKLKYAESEDVAKMLDDFLPNETFTIQVDERTHSVTIKGTPEDVAVAGSRIADLDIELKQVNIAAYLMSVNADRVREFGINWQRIGSINGRRLSWVRNAVPPSGEISTGAVLGDIANEVNDAGDVVVSALQSDTLTGALHMLIQDNDTKILAEPQVTVIDGEEAIFEIVSQEPYQEGGIDTYSRRDSDRGFAPNIIPLRVIFETVGTQFKVIPRVSPDDKIKLDLSIIDSTAEQRNIISAGLTTTVPVVTENSVTTKIMVNNGQTIVIGGLKSRADTRNVDKYPILSELPFLGPLFKSIRHETDDRELLVFITCTILDDGKMDEDVEMLSDFSKNLQKAIIESRKGVIEKLHDDSDKRKTEREADKARKAMEEKNETDEDAAE